MNRILGLEGSDPTYPEEDGDNDGRTGTEVSAEGHRQVPGEEGQPAQEEASHDNSQCYKGLVFFSPHRRSHGFSLVRA